jgi:hypothetical protein
MAGANKLRLFLFREGGKMKRVQVILSWFGAATVGGLMVAVVVGASGPPKVVEAQDFVLRDAQGQLRGSFRVQDGRAIFSLLDGAGRSTGTFSVAEDGRAILSLGQTEGTSRKFVALLRAPDGSPGIVLQGEGKKTVAMAIPNDNDPAMQMTSKTGVPIPFLP